MGHNFYLPPTFLRALCAVSKGGTGARGGPSQGRMPLQISDIDGGGGAEEHYPVLFLTTLPRTSGAVEIIFSQAGNVTDKHLSTNHCRWDSCPGSIVMLRTAFFRSAQRAGISCVHRHCTICTWCGINLV